MIQRKTIFLLIVILSLSCLVYIFSFFFNRQDLNKINPKILYREVYNTFFCPEFEKRPCIDENNTVTIVYPGIVSIRKSITINKVEQASTTEFKISEQEYNEIINKLEKENATSLKDDVPIPSGRSSRYSMLNIESTVQSEPYAMSVTKFYEDSASSDIKRSERIRAIFTPYINMKI